MDWLGQAENGHNQPPLLDTLFTYVTYDHRYIVAIMTLETRDMRGAGGVWIISAWAEKNYDFLAGPVFRFVCRRD
jgi:hypothetical protein